MKFLKKNYGYTARAMVGIWLVLTILSYAFCSIANDTNTLDRNKRIRWDYIFPGKPLYCWLTTEVR